MIKENKNKPSNKNNIKFIASLGLHIISIAAIVVLALHVNFLYRETQFLNKQSLQFNARTNNVEGCFKNHDYTCPEDKYFDSRQFMK